MKILALNAYHGGSHREFLRGWQQASRHRFEVWTLPAYKWKWRMRHAAVTFAEQLKSSHHTWDCIFCTDMLNVAELRGLCPRRYQSLPLVVYFHENQLTYPQQHQDQRDLHFAFTNLTTALAADAIWFNSQFHLDAFLAGLEEWLPRMPDHQPTASIRPLREKAVVQMPGIDPPARRPQRNAGPLRIVWVSRWEHDKGPQQFFAALRLLRRKTTDFRLRIVGQSFAEFPAEFMTGRAEFNDLIEQWGYVPERHHYAELLATSDVVVSTAEHEFFGIGVLEAVSSGCWPLVPRRLAYPEVLGDDDRFFHASDEHDLADRLADLVARVAQKGELPALPNSLRSRIGRFHWSATAARMDQSIEALIGQPTAVRREEQARKMRP